MSFIPTDEGRWVSAEFARLAEVIQDYDPYLELRWIPPENRTELADKTKPYIIVDTRINQAVIYASEKDTPVAILGKLFNSDNRHGDVLQRLDNYNAAAKVMQLKEELEKREEAKDLAAFAIGNTKSKWRHNGINFDDEFRRLGTGQIVIP